MEEIIKPMILYCDSTSDINISKDPVMHTKNKNIVIKYHCLRDLVQDKEVKMKYLNTKEKIIDIFTNELPEDAHEYLRGKLGVIPLSKAI